MAPNPGYKQNITAQGFSNGPTHCWTGLEVKLHIGFLWITRQDEKGLGC